MPLVGILEYNLGLLKVKSYRTVDSELRDYLQVKHFCDTPNTPVPQRFWLILHSSEARFISSGHLRKTIVSQSDESDLCLLTIRSVSDVFDVV